VWLLKLQAQQQYLLHPSVHAMPCHSWQRLGISLTATAVTITAHTAVAT
jgi:hypothetical protein